MGSLVEHSAQIRQVEVADTPDLRQIQAVFASVARASYPRAAETFTYQELLMGSERTRWDEVVYLGAFRDGDCLGAVGASFPLTDNLANAFVEIAVLPQARRSGVGAALYTALLDQCRQRDRSQVITEISADYSSGATDPADWHPGARFLNVAG